MSKQYQDELQSSINLKADEIIKQLPDFAHKYFDHLKTIDRSARTRLQYAYDLKRFFDFLQEQSGFADIKLSSASANVLDLLSYDDIQEYLNTLNESQYVDYKGKVHNKKNSSSFKARNISTLRSFYKFYYKHGEIEKDMANLMEMPKIKNVEKFALNQDQINRLIDAVEQKPKNKHIYRDKAILTILFLNGIRVSELVGIDIGDIDFNAGTVVINRKGGDQDLIYLSDLARDAIITYLENERAKDLRNQDERALFVSGKNQRISVRMVQDLVSKYSALAGLSNMHVTPHTARRTYGTYLYEQTGDIYLVAETLHHSSIQTTRRYAKMNENYKKRAKELSDSMLL